MPKKSIKHLNFDQQNIYQIRVKGTLDQQWSDWFDGLNISPTDDGSTLLTGPVVDDAALHGLLKKVRDSGVQLLSVNQVENALADDDASGRSGHGLSDLKEKGEGKI
jgi:hypothetical protein